MGLKTEAKEIAAAAKVACVPGCDGPVASEAEALAWPGRSATPC